MPAARTEQQRRVGHREAVDEQTVVAQLQDIARQTDDVRFTSASMPSSGAQRDYDAATAKALGRPISRDATS